MVYIGIDLGTTYSRVAVVENGQPKAIPSDHGGNIVPSVVSYDENEILVGNPAVICNTDLSNILYDSKRLIGWHIVNNLPNFEGRQLWTFNVDTRNNCAGYVLNKGKSNEKFLKPEEVSAEILKNLKACAEKYLSEKVTGCVVTVPAIFTEQQLAATKRAVEMAGLNLIRLLHEPTAAAIAYNQKNKLGNSTILLFDWGGGTLDVTIAEMKNDQVSIKAISGESHLGGQDIDARIMKFVNEESKKSHKYDIFKKAKLIKQLRRICREAKEALSFKITSCNIQMDIGENDLNVELSKEKLHDLCKDIFEKAMNLVDQALNTARMTADSIDHVILVGGTTRMPTIQQLLEKKFGRSKLKFDINPDEAVARGAAIYASSTQIFFYLLYDEYPNREGRICLFNSNTFEVEIVEKFSTCPWSHEVAIGKNKMFLINEDKRVFEIFNYETKQLTRGPNPPEWRWSATVAYYKNKLYYIGGRDSNDQFSTSVNILVNGRWQREPDFPINRFFTGHVICNDKLYIISENAVFQLSDDEREWIEVGKIEVERFLTAVVSLNGKIYVTGGVDNSVNALNSCLCFDPSQPFDRRFTSIADMNYKRVGHSLVVANEKLYAIGGYQDNKYKEFCKSVEEYDPTTNQWRISNTTLLNINSLSINDTKLSNIPSHNDNETIVARAFHGPKKLDPKPGKQPIPLALEDVSPREFEWVSNNDDDRFNNSGLFYVLVIGSHSMICRLSRDKNAIEILEKFPNFSSANEVQITVDSQIFLVDSFNKSFKYLDKVTSTFVDGSRPSKWRQRACLGYWKKRIYYIGGLNNKLKPVNDVDIFENGKWIRGPALPMPISNGVAIVCNEKLYVIDDMKTYSILQLSQEENEWINVGSIAKKSPWPSALAVHANKIYITPECQIFDPEAPVKERNSKISDMLYQRQEHSLITTPDGKLIVIGGYRLLNEHGSLVFCEEIEEYDLSSTNKMWKVIGYCDEPRKEHLAEEDLPFITNESVPIDKRNNEGSNSNLDELGEGLKNLTQLRIDTEDMLETSTKKA